MKKLVCAVMLSVLSFAVCGCDNTVIAGYDGGKITRGDFRQWAKDRNFNAKTLFSSKAEQESKLNMMIVERLAVVEAKKSGFADQGYIKNLMPITGDSLLARMFIENYVESHSKTAEEMVRVSHILIKVNNVKYVSGKPVPLSIPELTADYDKAMVRAKAIIEAVNKGESFEDAAKRASDDISRTTGGDVGFVMFDMMPREYSEKAFALKEGEMSMEPVKTGQGVYIIKVTKRKKINLDKIDSIASNEFEARRMKGNLRVKIVNSYIEELQKANDVAFYRDRVASADPRAVIYKIGTVEYTVADFNNQLDVLRKMQAPASVVKVPALTEDQRKQLALDLFQLAILVRDARAKKYDTDKAYIAANERNRDMQIAREYLKSITSGEMNVTPDMVLKEYNLHKEDRYYRMDQANGNKKVVLPLTDDLRAKIERILTTQGRTSKMNEWRTEMKKKYHVVIYSKKFEGK